MDNPGYIGLTRMKGLADEMRAVANNIANSSTTGFRSEALVFAEVLAQAPVDGGALAMAAPRAHVTDPSPGGFTATGGNFDLAIEGEGYFQVLTPQGPRLTRAGAFLIGPDGAVQNAQGAALLDAGGGPILIAPDARNVLIAEDGAISVNGQPVGQVGVFDAPPESLLREDGVTFRTDAAPDPAPDARIKQGFLEDSNVSPVEQMARMIEVQRAYELGQSFLDMEDERLREAVRTIGRTG